MVQWVLIIVALGLMAAVGALLALLVSAYRRPRVIALIYHRLAPRQAYEQMVGVERIFTLPVDVFEGQIAWLVEAGYTFVTPDQVRAFVAGKLDLPDPSVLVTFDDGCWSVIQLAFPILERYKVCAICFVTTDPQSAVFSAVGENQRRMTDEELRCVDGETIHIGSHAVSHRPLRGMSADQIRYELGESKQELERVLSRDVRFLAIPGNWFDRQVMRIARKVGYKAVWYSNVRATHVGDCAFGLPRINVEGHLSVPQFIAAIRPFGILQRRLVSLVKRAPGRVLGPRFWLPIRKVIMSCIPGGYISTRRILAAGAVVVATSVLILVWLAL